MTFRKTCPVCGTSFETNCASKKYCGYQCYCDSKHKRQDVVAHRTESTENRVYAPKKRRCHDCGRPTTNYRCEKCWSKIRKGDDL